MTEREEIMEEYALSEREMDEIEAIADENGGILENIASNYVQCKWEIEEPDDMW
jgi:hypothetical protein